MKEPLERLVTELKRYGVKPSLARTGSGHVRVSWQAEGQTPRSMIVASTISDWRGTLNNVAMIRRWCREDQLVPIAERVPLSAKVRETPGKINLTPVFKAIEKLQSQIEELFNYITTPEAVTEEPKAAYSSGRVPSTDLLQHLSLTEWTPAARLAIKAARPYANVQSALKQLELKGLAVNYKGVGWKRTPPEAVQVKVKPRVIVAAPPVQPAKPEDKAAIKWLDYFGFGHWTSALEFARKANVTHDEAHRLARELEAQGHLQHDAKTGWRRWAKRKTLVPQRKPWGGRAYGVPSDNLLPFLTHKYQPNSALAAAWGRTLTQTMDALKSLEKRGLVENKRYVGWRLSSSTPKTNGKHHHPASQEHHH